MQRLELTSCFKFQSDSINTYTRRCRRLPFWTLNSNLILLILNRSGSRKNWHRTLNSNLILLILSQSSCFVHHFVFFKFQSDSINTYAGWTIMTICMLSLNSNLILLIPMTKLMKFRFFNALNSNLILLIPIWKFQIGWILLTLNSNLILLIPTSSRPSAAFSRTLNSNLILLIPRCIFELWAAHWL